MDQAKTAAKPKVAFYWAASCGGCECTVVDIGEPLLAVVEKIELVFWPVALDYKYHHIRAMADKSIDLCLFNGAIRTSEQEEMAKLFRAKSKILVAVGSCAHMGGIPGLADFSSKQGVLNTMYKEVPSLEDVKENVFPQLQTTVKEGALKLPEIHASVSRLCDVVDVDYTLPGCPPTSEQVTLFLLAVLEGRLPPPGAVFGPKKNLCDECKRERKEKAIKKFYRPHEKRPDPNECLLDQGFSCLGPITRAGCKALCVDANMPCRGCYGPTDKVEDMGAAFVSTLASVIDADDEAEIQKIVDQLPDVAGTVYRFGLPACITKNGSRKNKGEKS